MNHLQHCRKSFLSRLFKQQPSFKNWISKPSWSSIQLSFFSSHFKQKYRHYSSRTHQHVLFFRQRENWEEIKAQIKQEFQKKETPKKSIYDFDLFSGAEKPLVHIKGYSDYGFLFNTDEVVIGSVIVFRDGYFSWNVKLFDEITFESLAPVWLHHPIPNILLIGCGESVQWLKADVIESLQKKGIVVEMLQTRTAIGTFNMLNQEERAVAAALLTVKPYNSSAIAAFERELKPTQVPI